MHGWEKVMPNDEIKETVQKLKIAWAELKSHLKWQRSTVTVWRDRIRNVGEGWAGLDWKQQKGEQTHKQMADRAANASHCWWKSMNDITETVIKDMTEDNSRGRGSELTAPKWFSWSYSQWRPSATPFISTGYLGNGGTLCVVRVLHDCPVQYGRKKRGRESWRLLKIPLSWFLTATL